MARTPTTRFPTGTNSIRITGVLGSSATSDEQVTIPAGFDISATSWALSLWVYPLSDRTELGFNGCCFAQEDGVGTGRAWIVPYDSIVTNETSIFFNALSRRTGFTFTKNVWNRFGLIYNQPINTITCYLNGVAYNSFDSNSPAPFVVGNSSGSFLLGANKSDAFSFDGNISMVHMWKDVVLTAEEMAGVHLRNDIPEEGLHFSLPMTQTAGDVLDVSGNGYNGVLSGGAAWDTSVGPFPIRQSVVRTPVVRTAA